MEFLPISFSSPVENILFDEFLLCQAEDARGPEVLRIWESPSRFVVLGRTGKLEEDVDLSTVKEDSVPVFRRTSGGGTVVQGPGCLNFSLVLSRESRPALNDIRRSYREILGPMCLVLKELGVAVEFRPISDLALAGNDKKFSGNAQHRGRKAVLHHGTILYNFDLELIPRYLKMPKAVPEYRRGRDHADFVTNVPVTREDFTTAVRKIFRATDSRAVLTAEEKILLADFSSHHGETVLI